MSKGKEIVVPVKTMIAGQEACVALLQKLLTGGLIDEHVDELSKVLGVPPDEVGNKLTQLAHWSAGVLNPTQPQVPFPIENQQQPPDSPADL